MARYVRGRVNETLALSTLAATTLISDIFDDLPTTDMFISSLVGTWSMQNMTAGADDGPIMVGLAHSDYSDAEIEATIETIDSWDTGNLVSQEIRKRLVRIVGIFGNIVPAPTVPMVLNDGRPIKTKLNWNINTGQGLRLWAYNLGASALATTDPQLFLQGHANLWSK